MKVFESCARPGKYLKIWSKCYKGSYINYVIANRLGYRNDYSVTWEVGSGQVIEVLHDYGIP